MSAVSVSQIRIITTNSYYFDLLRCSPSLLTGRRLRRALCHPYRTVSSFREEVMQRHSVTGQRSCNTVSVLYEVPRVCSVWTLVTHCGASNARGQVWLAKGGRHGWITIW